MQTRYGQKVGKAGIAHVIENRTGNAAALAHDQSLCQGLHGAFQAAFDPFCGRVTQALPEAAVTCGRPIFARCRRLQNLDPAVGKADRSQLVEIGAAGKVETARYRGWLRRPQSGPQTYSLAGLCAFDPARNHDPDVARCVLGRQASNLGVFQQQTVSAAARFNALDFPRYRYGPEFALQNRCGPLKRAPGRGENAGTHEGRGQEQIKERRAPAQAPGAQRKEHNGQARKPERRLRRQTEIDADAETEQARQPKRPTRLFLVECRRQPFHGQASGQDFGMTGAVPARIMRSCRSPACREVAPALRAEFRRRRAASRVPCSTFSRISPSQGP